MELSKANKAAKKAQRESQTSKSPAVGPPEIASLGAPDADIELAPAYPEGVAPYPERRGDEQLLKKARAGTYLNPVPESSDDDEGKGKGKEKSKDKGKESLFDTGTKQPPISQKGAGTSSASSSSAPPPPVNPMPPPPRPGMVWRPKSPEPRPPEYVD